MNRLVALLENIADSNNFLRFDTRVFNNIRNVSTSIESLLKEGESRISAYVSGLRDFGEGMYDSYQQKGHSSEISTANRKISTPYGVGYKAGGNYKSIIKEAEGKGEIESYKMSLLQSKFAADILAEKLEPLIEASINPHNFLLRQISEKSDGFEHIANGLVKLFISYEDLIKQLLNGDLDKKTIKQLEDKEEHAKLGIVYLVMGRAYNAQYLFRQAMQEASGELQKALKDVSSSIGKASEILTPAYYRIQLAHEFEKAGNKRKAL